MTELDQVFDGDLTERVSSLFPSFSLPCTPAEFSSCSGPKLGPAGRYFMAEP